jgi:hypothetical protein
MKSSSTLSLLLAGLVHQTVAEFQIFKAQGLYYVCPGFDNECSCLNNPNGANITTFTTPDPAENLLTSNFSVEGVCGIHLIDFQLTGSGEADVSIDGIGGVKGSCGNGATVGAQTCTVDGTVIDWFEMWTCTGPICGDPNGYVSIYHELK